MLYIINHRKDEPSMKSNKQSGTGFKAPIIFSLFLIMLFFLGGCGSSSKNSAQIEAREWKNIRVKTIEFICDQHINQGMLLPVDIIYITKYHMPREVIAIGPNKWFESLKRENWETKQTLSLKGGEAQTLDLNRLWLKDTKLLIIFANFKNVEGSLSQQIVLDDTAKTKIKILVLPQTMMVERSKKKWFDLFDLFDFRD